MVRTMALIPRGILLTPLNRVQDGEQKIMRKGHGQLIHVLDFVEEENGCLIVCDEEGDIVKDVQCIIYPGVDGDAWWDQDQLLVQVDKAIAIFEEVHPSCVAVT